MTPQGGGPSSESHRHDGACAVEAIPNTGPHDTDMCDMEPSRLMLSKSGQVKVPAYGPSIVREGDKTADSGHGGAGGRRPRRRRFTRVGEVDDHRPLAAGDQAPPVRNSSPSAESKRPRRIAKSRTVKR